MSFEKYDRERAAVELPEDLVDRFIIKNRMPVIDRVVKNPEGYYPCALFPSPKYETFVLSPITFLDDLILPLCRDLILMRHARRRSRLRTYRHFSYRFSARLHSLKKGDFLRGLEPMQDLGLIPPETTGFSVEPLAENVRGFFCLALSPTTIDHVKIDMRDRIRDFFGLNSPKPDLNPSMAAQKEVAFVWAKGMHEADLENGDGSHED